MASAVRATSFFTSTPCPPLCVSSSTYPRQPRILLHHIFSIARHLPPPLALSVPVLDVPSATIHIAARELLTSLHMNDRHWPIRGRLQWASGLATSPPHRRFARYPPQLICPNFPNPYVFQTASLDRANATRRALILISQSMMHRARTPALSHGCSRSDNALLHGDAAGALPPTRSVTSERGCTLSDASRGALNIIWALNL